MNRLAIFALTPLIVLYGQTCFSQATVPTVNPMYGTLIWTNTSGSPLEISAYSITSDDGRLVPVNWLSFTDHYDADSGGAAFCFADAARPDDLEALHRESQWSGPQ